MLQTVMVSKLDTFEQAQVWEVLQQIPIQQRTVIELAFWDGMTRREITLHCQNSHAYRHAEIAVNLAGIYLITWGQTG